MQVDVVHLLSFSRASLECGTTVTSVTRCNVLQRAFHYEVIKEWVTYWEKGVEKQGDYK
jgi:hypothetical protein